MSVIPHFDYPFRFRGSSFAFNDQDSLDDLKACVLAVMLYEPGFREMLPEFGIEDLAFETQPLNQELLVRAVARWEPRVHLLIAQEPDAFDQLVAHLSVAVAAKEA